ncbi:pyrroline-5-carboxylate reductase [Microbacterium sp. YY-01]|uniref:pyrroline-5-carboxylate reductase n=1 Tax=Microbacterium sp. YY-01 TaxID=3421634 RepID=UPI003D173A4A
MTTSLPSLAFLGAGSMGGAIVRGVVASGAPRDGDITVTNRTRARAATLADCDGVVSVALEDDADANREAAAHARIIVVGVKPAMVPALLAEIAPVLRDDAIVVSIAAGVTLATFTSVLGDQVRTVRAMPNTPATVRQAVTGLSAGAATDAEDMALVHALFATVGAVIEVAEDKIDALSTISGSGPAYVYLLIEEFTRAAEGKGFSAADARLMVEQTFMGAIALLEASGDTPRELRRAVTSPKGTTEQAIAVLQQAKLHRTFTEATDAALARARELAAGA